MHRHAVVASLVVMAAALTACGSDDPAASTTTSNAPTATTTPGVPTTAAPAPTSTSTAVGPIDLPDRPDGVPLATWTLTGGLCVDGNICSTTYELFADGSALVAGAIVEEGAFADEAAALEAALGKADVAALDLEPFTDTCPTAYDGQEQVITFPVEGVTLAGCTVVLDPAVAPLGAAQAALDAMRSSG